MLVNREISQSPFIEVGVGSIASLFTLKLATPGFVEIDGQSVLIAAGQRETQFFDGSTFISIFSADIDYYAQAERGKYPESDFSNVFENV